MGGTKLRTLQNWEGAKNFPSSEFLADAAKFGVDVQYIITGRRSLRGEAPAPVDDAAALRVPLFSASASMGDGCEVLEADVVVGEVPVSHRWLAQHLPRVRPQALRLIHARGDSMAGTLEAGDLALVDTDQTAADVDGVYVLQAGGQLFIKRVTRKIDGRAEVTSDNPRVRTVDVLDGEQAGVAICGRVVFGWNGRRL